MSTAEQDKELTDIVLCYQSMGLALDASPPAIDHRYNSLTEEYRRKLVSADPALREEAKLSLALLPDMYEKIKGSITYRAFQKEHLKNSSQASATAFKPKRPVHPAVSQKSLMINCPRCNGLIAKGLKTCPVCKTTLYTPLQKIQRTFFTPKLLIVYCIVVLVAAVGVYGFLHPESLSQLKALGN